MKNFVFAVLMLSLFVAWFSFSGLPFLGGSGEPIPSNEGGADGQAEVTTAQVEPANESKATAKALNTIAVEQAPFSFAVTVEQQEQEQEQEQEQTETFQWGIFWSGVGVGVLAAQIGILLVITTLWIIEKVRRKHGNINSN